MESRHSSVSGGVPIFSIGGRMIKERERLLGMTDEERRWRAQYLKDQILDPDEPRFSPEYYRETTNIFRRTIRYPMELLQSALTPVLGKKRAITVRYITGRYFVCYLMICAGTYYMKYNSEDWSRDGGWFMNKAQDPMLPGDPGYPNYPKLKPYEYYDGGFSKSHFFKE